tara:strand:+ start:2290 stop:3273 length:984 start_codon:yes stop_codon:yes gene_type:complete
MKTTLITGGLGFIGSSICEVLLKKKYTNKCILLDNFGGYMNPIKDSFVDFRKQRFSSLKNIIIERCDTSNYKALSSILNKHKPNYVYHTAALPLAKVSNLNNEEAKVSSVDSTVNIIDAINLIKNSNKGYKFSRFIYFSSSMIYGDFKKSTVNEKSEKNPKDAYGIMKLAGEVVTEGLCRLHNIPYTIIRPSAVYGPKDMNRRVSQIFIENAFENKEIHIQGKDEKLDFTFIKDLANGTILAARSKKGINEIFNITCGKGQTLLKYVKYLKKKFPYLKYVVKERDKSKPSRGTLSINKAKKLLGYRPKYSLKDGIDEYFKFLKKNIR